MHGNRALFLDRDGVINHDYGYVHKVEDFHFVEGIFDLCRAAKQEGMLIVVVTNQAGIARGYYSEKDFLLLTDWMRAQFMDNRVQIDAVYHCPYHPDHGIGPYKRSSFYRKPNPGMILKAESELGIDLSRSVLVGDNITDMEAAQNAGIGKAILVGKQNSGGDSMPHQFVNTLPEITRLLFG